MATQATYSSLVLKGTRHGLLASIREDADWMHILAELNSLHAAGEDYLQEASLTFDFGWREVTEIQFDQVIASLHQQGLSCNGILSTSLNTRTIAESRGYRAIIGRLGLAKHQGRRLRREQEEANQIKVAEVPDTVIEPKTPELATTVSSQAPAPESSSCSSPLPVDPTLSALPNPFSPNSTEVVVPTILVSPSPAGQVVPPISLTPTSPSPSGAQPISEAEVRPVEPSLEVSVEESVETTSPSQEGIHVPRYQDEEPTLYLRKTLRSGQKVVFAGNVVLLGDLNPGAQIEADGDIIVLGQLRGTVHAGAEGDRDSTIVTSSLRPTQLRIADRFWSGEKGNSFFKKSQQVGTVRARLDGDSVVVESLPTR